MKLFQRSYPEILTMNTSQANSSKKNVWVRLLVGSGVTIGCLLFFFQQLNVSEVLDAFSNLNWIYLTASLLPLAIDFTLRTFRWAQMLRSAGAIVTTKDCFTPYLSSIALNNILPFRLGDVIRVTIFPKYLGITKTLATGSLIIERLVDLMTILLFLTIGLLVIDNRNLPDQTYLPLLFVSSIGSITLGSALCFSGFFMRFFTAKALASSLQKKSNLFRLYNFLAKLFLSFEAMLEFKSLCRIIILSIFIFSLEAGIFYLLFHAVGLEFSFVSALFVMSFTILSTMIPAAPGYAGTFHLATFTAMSLLGATSGQAGSYAVIVHLVLWLATTLAGFLAIWFKPNFFRIAKSHMAKNDESCHL